MTTVDSRITWTLNFMQTHLAEPITVSGLAAQVNLSPSRFRSLFVAQTTVAPAVYLRRLRLRRARLLIERTFLTVKEVMAQVGYSDPSHFTRDFRREHGHPPTAFRGQGLATPMRSRDGPSVETLTSRRIGQVRTMTVPAAVTAEWIVGRWLG